MTNVVCVSNLRWDVMRSSMHPCPGNLVAIGRCAVVNYDRVAQAFSTGIKCWHCILHKGILAMHIPDLVSGMITFPAKLRFLFRGKLAVHIGAKRSTQKNQRLTQAHWQPMPMPNKLLISYSTNSYFLHRSTWTYCRCLVAQNPWIKCQKLSQALNDHVACDWKLHSLVRSSTHPSPGHRVTLDMLSGSYQKRALSIYYTGPLDPICW